MSLKLHPLINIQLLGANLTAALFRTRRPASLLRVLLASASQSSMMGLVVPISILAPNKSF